MDEYLERKRRDLGLDRADDLTRVQGVLDKWYPGMARARQWHQGVLRVVTPNSSVASELRMRQLELLQACGLGTEGRLAISIQSLS
jgi:hypothetical protein